MTIDDCDDQVDATIRRDLDSLAHLGSTKSAGLTIIQVERTDGDAAGRGRGGWLLSDRSRAADAFPSGAYLTHEARMGGEFGADLHAAGDHTAARFVAGRSARTGAARVTLSDRREPSAGLEVINPELVDAVARECLAGIARREPVTTGVDSSVHFVLASTGHSFAKIIQPPGVIEAG